MASIDICNIALSYLGDAATVVSIDPPEGSAQAEHCARFYPLSLNELLEAHTWGFAVRRETLALLTAANAQWEYVYAHPSDAVRIIAVLDAEASNDYVIPFIDERDFIGSFDTNFLPQVGVYAPSDFVQETLTDGSRVILTNREGAIVRYVAFITDTAKFSPLFASALAWLLASKLAGALIKGKEGADQAIRCLRLFEVYKGRAMASDAMQRQAKPEHLVTWITGR